MNESEVLINEPNEKDEPAENRHHIHDGDGTRNGFCQIEQNKKFIQLSL